MAERFLPVDLDTPGLRIMHFDPPVFTLPGFFTGGCNAARSLLPFDAMLWCRFVLAMSWIVLASLPPRLLFLAAAEEECDDAVAAALESGTLVPSKVSWYVVAATLTWLACESLQQQPGSKRRRCVL